MWTLINEEGLAEGQATPVNSKYAHGTPEYGVRSRAARSWSGPLRARTPGDSLRAHGVSSDDYGDHAQPVGGQIGRPRPEHDDVW